MRGEARLSQVTIGIVTDCDGTEGVPAFLSPQGPLPVFSASADRFPSMRLFAQRVADETLQSVVLARFTEREDIETLTPMSAAGPVSAPYMPFTAADGTKLIDEPATTFCESVVVIGARVEGESCFILELHLRITENETVKLPVLFAGKVADDLHDLIRDGYEVIKATDPKLG